MTNTETEGLVDVDAAIAQFDLIVATEDADPTKCAHFVPVPVGQDDETPHAYVMRARFEGFAVKALCGHEFIPQQDATALPPCARCRELWEALPDDMDGASPHQ